MTKCNGCSGRVGDNDYISLMGLCSKCARDEHMRRVLPAKAPADENGTFEDVGVQPEMDEIVTKFEAILSENDALRARITALEEVARFYVAEDDGGGKAGRVLGLW